MEDYLYLTCDPSLPPSKLISLCMCALEAVCPSVAVTTKPKM